jgi:hypothetical protein
MDLSFPQYLISDPWKNGQQGYFTIRRPAFAGLDIDEEVPAGESRVRTLPLLTRYRIQLPLFLCSKTIWTKKLIDLKDYLKEEARSTTDLAANKLKETSELTFIYEGNKQQHKFNRGLADQIAFSV